MVFQYKKSLLILFCPEHQHGGMRTVLSIAGEWVETLTYIYAYKQGILFDKVNKAFFFQYFKKFQKKEIYYLPSRTYAENFGFLAKGWQQDLGSGMFL